MESGGYLSPPLIMIAILFAARYWGETLGRLMVDLLIIVLMLALGPRLHILSDNEDHFALGALHLYATDPEGAPRPLHALRVS